MVQFDVCGQLFRVPVRLIRSKPSTELAKLVEKHAGGAAPIFVDTAPERFGCILDWYRYGEIFVPKTVPLAAVLQDARRLGLPEEVVVNGAPRSTRPSAARKVGRELLAAVISGWRGFEVFFDALLRRIQAHFEVVGRKGKLPPKPPPPPPPQQSQQQQQHNGEKAAGLSDAAAEEEEEEAYDFPPFVLPLFGETGWIDPSHISSGPRARAVALWLEERGYLCEFTDTELLVSLPLRLKAEVLGGYAFDGEDEELFGEEEEETAGQEAEYAAE